jgi:hypothetical protein
MERVPAHKAEIVTMSVSYDRRQQAAKEVQAALVLHETVEVSEQIAVLKKMLGEYGSVIPGTDQAANESMYYHAEAAAELLSKILPDPARVYAESITPTNVNDYKINT